MDSVHWKWMRCPTCGHPHMLKVREDTVLQNSICFCRKCKTENLISYVGPRVSVK